MASVSAQRTHDRPCPLSHLSHRKRHKPARSALDAGHSVADSARLAGFESAETWRRVFVSQLGISPKA